jgi:mono/diheme cytochrome c family protein
MLKKIQICVVLTFVLSLMICSLVIMRQPAQSSVMRGYVLATEMGCFACHGEGGIGGVPNFGALWGETPPLKAGGPIMSFIQSEEEISEWILYGKPRRLLYENDKPSSDKVNQSTNDEWDIKQGVGGLVKMPAYEGVLTEDELFDLVAYVKVVTKNAKPLSRQAEQGYQISLRLGCLGCHSSIHGGVSNPGSFKGYIPPWDGYDFAELVENETELEQWILKGNIDRYKNNPFANYFIKGQTIQMPSYEKVLQEGELEAIISYIKWLRDENRQYIQDLVETEPPKFISIVKRGEWLYKHSGCIACHGPEGRGGIPNKNSSGGYVPSLDDLAEKMELFEQKEVEVIIRLFERGLSLDDPSIEKPLPYFESILSEYLDIREVILKGSFPGKKGQPTAMVMPAWKHRLYADKSPPIQADINAVIAYMISLQDFENDEL